jgi:hypothetical protein
LVILDHIQPGKLEFELDVGLFRWRAVLERATLLRADAEMVFEECYSEFLGLCFRFRIPSQLHLAHHLAKVQTPVTVDIDAHEQEFREEGKQDLVVFVV